MVTTESFVFFRCPFQNPNFQWSNKNKYIQLNSLSATTATANALALQNLTEL